MPRLSLTAALALAASAASAAAAQGAPPVADRQRLAVLLAPHTAVPRPSMDATPGERVAAHRPLTGARTVLPVLAELRRDGRDWLRVRLPGRPNGHAGWIRRHGTALTSTDRHIVVRTASRRVVLLRGGRSVGSFRAIVGTPSTPTPVGRLFVEESLRLGPADAGRPFALALSARSNVFQEFAGGPGQIALHGRGGVGGILGTAASHGCVRLGDRALRRVVAHSGPGVPVTIVR
ncbi:MAG TPA: L,D-transpeptidase [Capillimicrobium sp.]|jgi:lipoprotein-anchoring transpeptidase ErfK/SrfK